MPPPLLKHQYDTSAGLTSTYVTPLDDADERCRLFSRLMLLYCYALRQKMRLFFMLPPQDSFADDAVAMLTRRRYAMPLCCAYAVLPRY